MFGMNSRSRRLRAFGIACLMLVQAVFPSMSTAQVGQGGSGAAPVVGVINSMSGPVFVRSASGAEIPLKPGDGFSSRSIVSTGVGGEVILLFADGLHVTLVENSLLNIDDYRFNPGDSRANRAVFTLVSGMMRLVTGAMHLANRNALEVKGADAVVTVISTDVTSFVVQADGGTEAELDVAVVVGQVSIRGTKGRADGIVPDQFVRWRSGAVSALYQPLASAPASLQALVRSLSPVAGAPLDIDSAAELAKLLASLPSTAAGQAVAEQAAPTATAELILPVLTPGGGQGCVGSPC